MAENSHKNSHRADHLRYRFRPGETGNPGGRPRGTMQFAELIAEETRNGAEMVEYALAVLRSRCRKAPKVWAVEYLTERMLGRAPQSIELTGKNGPPVEFSDARDELLARLARVLARAGAERKADLKGTAEAGSEQERTQLGPAGTSRAC
jgi:hypothetical protein